MKLLCNTALIICVAFGVGCGNGDAGALSEQESLPPVPVGADSASLSPAETVMMESMGPGGEADPNRGQ